MLQVRSAPILGLSVVGWTAGLLFVLTLCALVFSKVRRLGAANRVTMTRAFLVGGVTALVADSYVRPVPTAVIVAIASVALVLDAVDGYVARRTGSVSPFGARFDMEVDAFLICVLSLFVAHSLGLWVLAVGAMRYAYVVAGWAMPWLRTKVPPRYWRKVVAAVQGIVLTVAASGLLPTLLAELAVAGALALLIESFGRDVIWQWVSSHKAGIDVAGAAQRPEPVKQLRQARGV